MKQDVTYQKSARIATNSLLLFIRMFVITLLNLYIVRIILRALCDEDYGIFNTIGGFVTTVSFVNTVLALSMQRFFSYAMSQDGERRVSEILSVGVNLVFILGLLVFSFMETMGVWFVNTQLVFPEVRMEAVNYIFQFSIFSFLCALFQVPFTALIFAKEDSGIFAFVSSLEALLKLAVAAMISIVPIDSLIFYGAGLFVVSLCITVIYIIVCKRRYEECRYVRTRNRSLYQKILSFSGWTLLGTVSNTAMFQGSTLLLNIFFSSLAVVPFAIAQQINNAFSSLNNTMLLAFRPPMIKAYAANEHPYLNRLFVASNKFTIYILSMVGIPMIVEMPFVMSIWLGSISPQNVLFARSIIVFVICMAMSGPITVIMQASGFIKQYHLSVESITLLCLPITWFLFKAGFPASSVLLSMIGTCLMAHFIRLLCLRHYYNDFSIRSYFRNLILPAALITAIATGLAYLVHIQIGHALLRAIAVFLLAPGSILLMVSIYGLSKEEKEQLRTMISSFKSNKTVKSHD